MSEKRLSKLDADEVRAKAERNESLTLKELAVWTGYSYAVVRGWQDALLPVLNGKIFPEDFVLWRRRKMGLELSPYNAAHLPMLFAGKSGESVLTHD